VFLLLLITLKEISMNRKTKRASEKKRKQEKKSCKYKTELALRMTNTNKVVTLRSARGANYQTHPSIPASSLRSPKRKGEVGGEGSRAGREGRGRRELAAAAIRGGQPRSPRRAEFFFLDPAPLPAVCW
jgi:hypothetical protein